jgi:hypothetical protein
VLASPQVVVSAQDALAYYARGGAHTPLSKRADMLCKYALLAAFAARNAAAARDAAGDAAGALASLADASAALEAAGAEAFESFERDVSGQRGLSFEVNLMYGDALRAAGRAPDAVPPLRAALATARRAAALVPRAGAPRDAHLASERVSAAAGTLGGVLLACGDAEGARACSEEDAALCAARGDKLGETQARMNCGNALHRAAVAPQGAPGAPPARKAERLAAAAATFEAVREAAEALCSGGKGDGEARAAAEELRCAAAGGAGACALDAGDVAGALRAYEEQQRLATALLASAQAAPAQVAPAQAASAQAQLDAAMQGLALTRAARAAAAAGPQQPGSASGSAAASGVAVGGGEAA